MCKKLAITISGAVSLGSYEAGVLYELLSALRQHNSHPETPEEEKVYIDVITGASAGGMTAAIAVHKLLYEEGALADPYENAFYQAWVAEIDIERLFHFHGHDAPTMSVLSSQTIVDISQKLVTDRYSGSGKRSISKHAAVDVNNLSLGLALANLNGIDYSLKVSPAGSLTYTRHKDEFILSFPAAERPASDNRDIWDKVCAAAVSCGAVPFAFRVVDLLRDASELGLQDQVKTPSSELKFAYTDGGTFQNEPISLAKRLVDKIDKHRNLEQRFFLFVAPDLKASAANTVFNAKNAHFSSMAKRLFGAIFNQARFPDLLLAEEKNIEVGVLDDMATGLAKRLQKSDGRAIAHSLTSVAEPLLDALFPSKQEIEVARDRLRHQFADTYRGLDSEVKDAWIDAILTFERAAGLGETDEMTIYSIIAADKELAGADLFAFAGFFDRSYREHDYEVGREKAQAFLTSKGILGLPNGLRWTPAPSRGKDASLSGLKLRDMDRGVRERVRNQLLDRSSDILKKFGINWFMVGPVIRFIINLRIKRHLEKLLEL